MQVDGYSLDAQRDKLRKYAAYEDMIVAGEYSDEGFSGKNIQGRQEFQRMLNDIQDGKDGVSYVLVFKLSRFGRNAADVLNSLQLMQDFGVNLICVEDGIDSSKDAGKLMISATADRTEIISFPLSFELSIPSSTQIRFTPKSCILCKEFKTSAALRPNLESLKTSTNCTSSVPFSKRKKQTLE